MIRYADYLLRHFDRSRVILRAPSAAAVARPTAATVDATNTGDDGVRAFAPAVANSTVPGMMPINVPARYDHVRTPVAPNA